MRTRMQGTFDALPPEWAVSVPHGAPPNRRYAPSPANAAAGPGRWMILAAAMVCMAPVAAVAQDGDMGAADFDIADLDIADLRSVRITSSTLTLTEKRLVPAATTTLDADTIRKTGARDLNELADIAFPHSQIILHHSHVDHLGIRGIISDREDKYLLRVNDVTVNQRMYAGADVERDLPLLGDLREVTLISGPASATYGPGALAGVLQLRTHDGLSFQGADAQVRQVLLDETTAAELRYGQRIDDDAGVFLYYGIAQQDGADEDESPYVLGSSFATKSPGDPDVSAGEPVPFEVRNFHRGAFGRLKHKAHLSLVRGPLEIWARYTQGGVDLRPERLTLAGAPALDRDLGFTSMNRQGTVAATYRDDLSDEFHLDATLSYGFTRNDYDRNPPELIRDENSATARAIGTWTPSDRHAVALGTEYTHHFFEGPTVNTNPPVSDRWDLGTLSLMAEHQWSPCDEWTTFLSARMDKHPYTDWLVSPRGAVVYAPTASDTFKAIAAQAVRRSGDAELRRDHNNIGGHGDEECLKSAELRYDRQHDEHWRFGLGAFTEWNEAIGYVQSAGRSTTLGRFTILGLEPAIEWRNGGSAAILAHTWTRLLDAEDAPPGQGISAMPYGRGDRLASWAENVTKLTVQQDFKRKWTVNTSLRVYWGFDGAEDLARWNADEGRAFNKGTPLNLALADPGYDDAFGPNVYWNVGLEYRPPPRITLRADVYNIVAWMDDTLSKRNYILRGSEYSVEPAAVGFTARFAL